jgi:hypothetical protein
MLNNIDVSAKSVKGLCLDCMIREASGAEAGECRIPH